MLHGLRPAALALTTALLTPSLASAQGYDSGSSGSDGALVFPANAGVIQFDPRSYDPPLDPDDDGVYHFTTLTVGANTTVRLTTRVLPEGRPVVWLCSGAVVIDGTLNLDGDPGNNHNATIAAAFAGAGGWSGGTAPRADGIPSPGNGPGGGQTGVGLGGGAAGHTVEGQNAANIAPGGRRYGNDFLIPLMGGSGGGGCGQPGGGNGGGGGGALLIASSVSIHLNGNINARGGDSGTAGPFTRQGGGASGGAVRLVAPELDGTGAIRVNGGVGNTAGSSGRIRLEAYRFVRSFSISPNTALMPLASPGPALPPASAPNIRVVRVAGETVASTPTGSFEVPDVLIDAASTVEVEIEAGNIPLGTVLELTFQPQTGGPINVTSTPLSGTLELSTASAQVQFPHGVTRVFVRASWTP